MMAGEQCGDGGSGQAAGFGAVLRHYRELAGLSQEKLAERAGLSAKAIGAQERGERRRPYPHTIDLLANALGLEGPERRALIAAAAGMAAPAPSSPPARAPPGAVRLFPSPPRPNTTCPSN
jgi:transcriptional regulator with XRE-family HTH domain